jgi:glutathione S-transferase
MVLSLKGIKYEMININQKRRPEWYAEINPLGLTPSLQHDDGRNVNESVTITEYLVGLTIQAFKYAFYNEDIFQRFYL